MNEEQTRILSALRADIDNNMISLKKGEGGSTQPYIEHEVLTQYLLSIDPTISWTPVRDYNYTRWVNRYNKDTKQNEAVEIPVCVVTMEMTVQGVTRGDYGTGEGDEYGGPFHKAYSAALSRVAMRFGVAIRLWAEPQQVVKEIQNPQRHQAPAQNEVHWTKQSLTRFWVAAKNDYGLDNQQVHEALGVASVKDYTGTKAEAAELLQSYADNLPAEELI